MRYTCGLTFLTNGVVNHRKCNNWEVDCGSNTPICVQHPNTPNGKYCSIWWSLECMYHKSLLGSHSVVILFIWFCTDLYLLRPSAFVVQVIVANSTYPYIPFICRQMVFSAISRFDHFWSYSHLAPEHCSWVRFSLVTNANLRSKKSQKRVRGLDLVLGH